MRRRTTVLLALITLSALYWLGAWAYIRAEIGALQAAGEHEIGLTLREMSLVYPATWGWVVGAASVHALVIATSAWRRDREALIGGVASLVVHAVFAVSQGVLAPPG